MRGLRLARIAAQAELLRLRYFFRRQAIRVLLGAVACVFLLAALVGAHVAGAMVLAEHLTPIQAALAVTGIDAVIGILFAVMALRSSPGAVEREALHVRRTVVDQAAEMVLVNTLLGRLRGVRSLREFYEVVVAAAIAWLVGLRR